MFVLLTLLCPAQSRDWPVSWSRVKKGQDMPCAVSTVPRRVGHPFLASGNSSPQTSTFMIRTAGYEAWETLEPFTGCQIKERNRPFADMISKVLLSEERLRMWGNLTLWRVPHSISVSILAELCLLIEKSTLDQGLPQLI